MKRVISGFAALIGLVAIVVGMPVLLLAVAPIGAPRLGWTLDGLWQALSSPDDGTLMLTVFKVAGWVAWVILTTAIFVELAAAVRHMPAPKLPGFGVPQRFARVLVAGVVALFIAAGTVGGVAGSAAAQPGPTPSRGVAAVQTSRDHAAKPSGDAKASKTVTVKRGDTLSAIALEQTGKASNYTRIFQASRHTVQPGGKHLTNPDLILPGWRVTVPLAGGAAHATAKPTVVVQEKHEHSEGSHATTAAEAGPAVQEIGQAAPAAPVSADPAPVESAPVQAGSQAPAASAASPAEVDEAGYAPAWLLCGLAGAGSLLAGSLWLAVRRRRQTQFRSRRPGRAVSAPPPYLAPVEKTLAHEGAPTGDLVVFIDEVLRRMAARQVASGAPVPTLVGVDVAPAALTVRLSSTAALGPAWQRLDGADGQVWRVARDVDVDLVGPLEADGPPPWPQLVTLGWDEQGWRMVNLEALGVVSITGDRVYASDLARYLVSELAMSPWSRDVEIDCLSICPELPGLAPARLRYHDSDAVVGETVAAAVATVDRLGEVGGSLETARTLQAGDELWDSRVLVSAVSDGTDLHVLESLLTDNAGQTATSLLVVDDDTEPAGIQMHLSSNGRVVVPLLGLDLVVNGLTEAEAKGCVAVLAAGESLADVEVPVVEKPTSDWQTYCRVDGAVRDDLTVPRGTTPAVPASSVLPEPDEVYLTQTANTIDDLAALAPMVPATVRAKIEAVDPELDRDIAAWYSDSSPRPKLQVLGPMKVRVGAGGDPARAAARVQYYTEMVAYLASMPAGATTEDVADAFGIAPLRVRKDISVVRAWLGINPATGIPWLPEATKNRQATERGVGVYVIDDLLCDANLFLRLRLRGQARGVDGLEDLRAALRLVSGAPYDDIRSRGGIWLAETRDDQILLAAVVDVGHVVSTIALGAGDFDQARAAAQIAALAAPHEAIPQLDLAAIAAKAGNQGLAGELARDVVSWRDAGGEPIDLSSRAEQILRAKRWLEEGASRAG